MLQPNTIYNQLKSNLHYMSSPSNPVYIQSGEDNGYMIRKMEAFFSSMLRRSKTRKEYSSLSCQRWGRIFCLVNRSSISPCLSISFSIRVILSCLLKVWASLRIFWNLHPRRAALRDLSQSQHSGSACRTCTLRWRNLPTQYWEKPSKLGSMDVQPMLNKSAITLPFQLCSSKAEATKYQVIIDNNSAQL